MILSAYRVERDPGGRDTGEVANVVLLVTALLLPTLLGAALIAVARVVRWWQRAAERRAGVAGLPVPTLERAAADVRRLRAQLDRLEVQPPAPGRAVRMRALRGAYGEALATACRLLEVPPPPQTAWLATAEQYRVECALRDKGLDVTSAAVR